MAWEGVNAVDKAMIITAAIKSYGEWRTLTCKHPLYARYPQTAGSSPITMFERADSKHVGTVPNLIMMSTRGTVMPGEDPDAIIEQMGAWIKRAADNDAWLRDHPPIISWIKMGTRSVPAEIPGGHPIVRTISACYQEIVGRQPVIAGFISPADWQSLNTVNPVTTSLGFGPGDIRQAHTTDEFVPIDEIIECTKVLASTIIDWCGIE
jgi:acetylornithine deacetylase